LVLTRTRRWSWIVAGLVALAVVIGVIVVVNNNSSGSGSGSSSQVAQLKATLDAVPLPTGTALVDETARAAAGDSPAQVERQYRLPSAADATAEIHAGLLKADYQLVDPTTKHVDPGVWPTLTSTGGGDVYVLPPGKTGDGIELTWRGTRLDVTLQPGQVR
jgi:hypothetical protein